MGKGSSTISRPRRLHTITPAPPILGWAREVESLEEAGAELAVVFWRVLRKVRAWVETPPEGRAGLFGIDKRVACERLGQGCAHAPGLVEALGVSAQLIRAPEAVEARHLAEACHQVHAWAEERSLVKVAMLFAEAAALVEPEDAARANDAGRMCRRAARDDRAASWYHRALGLGVRYRAWQEIIRAQLGYGNLMKDLGQYDEARKYFERAAQRAISTGRQRQAGEAYHDLLTVAAEAGTYMVGERYVRKALDLYPLNHPRLPLLAQDWAFLLVRRRHYSPALSLLKIALPQVHTPELQTLVWGNYARAAAGARRQDAFGHAACAVSRMVQQHEEFGPSALNGVAEGYWVFKDWGAAESFASKALDLARKRKDGGEEQVALDLLEKIAAHMDAPQEEHLSHSERLDAINLRFEARLRKWKTPDHQKSGANPASAADRLETAGH